MQLLLDTPLVGWAMGSPEPLLWELVIQQALAVAQLLALYPGPMRWLVRLCSRIASAAAMQHLSVLG